MNVKISVFVICVEVIIYLLLYNLHDSTFKLEACLKYRIIQNVLCQSTVTCLPLLRPAFPEAQTLP